MTGTRASCCTRATKLLPPRGTITSMNAPCRATDTDGLAILRRHHLHRGCRQTVREQRAFETRMNGRARARALGAAAQDRRIAAFKHSAAASAVTFGLLS